MNREVVRELKNMKLKKGQIRIFTAIFMLAIMGVILAQSNETGNATLGLTPEPTNTSVDTPEPTPTLEPFPVEEPSPTPTIEPDPTIEPTPTEIPPAPTSTPVPPTPTPSDFPQLVIDISYPVKINRGDEITLQATITNIGNGNATGVSVDWNLPTGFNLLSENNDCSSILPSSSCTSNARIKTDTSALSGMNKVNVIAKY
jgi:uncharacterized repeat protein (TIGR01451 family)